MVNKRRAVSHIPRTLDALAREGYELHEKVERFTSYGGFGHRNDLFGFADIFAVKVEPQEFLLVQVCSASTLGAHKKKCERSQELHLWVAAGGAFEIWCWKKDRRRRGRWRAVRYRWCKGRWDRYG